MMAVRVLSNLAGGDQKRAALLAEDAPGLQLRDGTRSCWSASGADEPTDPSTGRAPALR
jgi:hypothetical protein